MDPEKDLAWKTQVTGDPAGGGLALGLGEADMQICSHQETISSRLEEKWDQHGPIYKPKSDLEKSKSDEEG